jgi:hypothetical protein
VLHFHGTGSAHVTGPDDDEEEHVVLGRLTPEPGLVRVQVNSLRRLKRLMGIFKEIGAAPEVTEESRFEPSLDFAWGPVPSHGLAARRWAESWLGQAVAVLDFRTPRHAAEGGQADRLRLEGLLRQLEYQSALPAERGGRPVDTAWLRAELGLKSMKHEAQRLPGFLVFAFRLGRDDEVDSRKVGAVPVDVAGQQPVPGNGSVRADVEVRHRGTVSARRLPEDHQPGQHRPRRPSGATPRRCRRPCRP